MSIIRIKRSGSTGSPTALAQGEMAYSFLGGTQSNGGDRLYIGTGTETGGVAANIEVIGGKYFTAKLSHVPGILTNNAAVIVDGTGRVDSFSANTLTVLAISANGSVGTAGQLLTSNGTTTYWSTVTGVTNIGQTSNSSTIALTSSTGSGTTLVAANSTVAGLLSADAQTIAGVKTFSSTITGSISGNAGTATTLETSRTLWGQSFNGGANVTGNLTSVGDITGTGAITLTATAATLALAATSTNVITLSTNGTETIRVSSNNNVGIGNTSPADKLSVNGSAYFGGNIKTTANVQIDGTLTVGGSTTIINATNLSVSDNMIYLNNGVTTSISAAVSNGTTFVYTANNNYSTSMVVTVTGVSPSGFNVVGATITTANSTTFTIANTGTPGSYSSGGTAIAKSSIYPDVGFAAGYNDGTYAHAGLFRDATDGRWKFFEGYLPEPDASVYIDTANTSFTLSTVQAATFVGAFSGNATTASSVNNAVTFNSSGSGDASGNTFNGSAAKTVSYNTVGASPLAGSSSLTTVGTITSGTWQGTLIGGTYGGTGVNNGAKTITIGGNVSTANSFTTSGNFALTLTQTAATSVTLPTSGTLVGSADTGTVTSTMIANNTIVDADINSSAAIAITKLAASTISGVSLGNNLNTLTFGTGLTAGGASYNGSAAITITAVTANNTVLGIASFDSTNFTVTTGAVSINTVDGGTY